LTDSFAHHLKLDAVRDGRRLDLVADEPARAAIAERLGLESIDRLEAHAVLSRNGDSVHVQGRVAASFTQRCVATGDPVAAHVDEAFEVQFLPEPMVDRADSEIELDPGDLDVVFHDGSAIDLGGAIADTLALSIDPFPRSAGAETALREAGVLTEAEASPFAVLAKLRKRDEP
jgi:uncharacterized metal-binding protein YceD (DUF177 family)